MDASSSVRLVVPEGADVAAFLLSDGRAMTRPTLPKMRTLKQLLDAYMDSLREGAIEQSTRQGMDIHIVHFRRVLGGGLIIAGLCTPPTCNAASMLGH
jgi:hypothetical protein